MINALRYTEELEKVGFSAEQAKKSVDTWMSLMDQNFATKADFREFQLVNRGDLLELRADLEGQIKDLRSDLEGQIKDLRSDLEGQIKDLRSDLEGQIKDLRLELKSEFSYLDKKMDLLLSKIVMQLGSLIVILFGVIPLLSHFFK